MKTKPKNVYESVVSVGLDVHYMFSEVSMRDGSGKVIGGERLAHADRAALRARLSRWPKQASYVMEASFGWGWLADELTAAGLQVSLANCFKLKKFRESRGPGKTNKKDAALLSELPLEKRHWWRVWVAPPEVRNQREWLRLRMDLVRLQTATKNRISAIFHRHGLFHDFSDLFGAAGRALLAELCRLGRQGEVQLADGALAALRHQVRLLGGVRGQLAEVTRKIRGRLAQSSVNGPPAPDEIV